MTNHRIICSLMVSLFLNGTIFSQNVGIGTLNPAASSVLELNSTTQGFLPPRMTLSQRNAIPGPAEGLMIICTDCSSAGNLQMFFSGK